jgi:polyvinyl alcohol dehydrogenase (cytochrome)
MASDWKQNHGLGSFAVSTLLLAAACAAGCGEADGSGGTAMTPAMSGPTATTPGQSPSAPPPSAAAGSGAPSGPTATPMAPGGSGTAPPTPGDTPAGTGSTPTTPPGGEGPAPAADANPHWVAYGGGAKNQFYNAAETKISVETAPMLKELWTVSLGEITGAPSVVGDVVYVVSNSGTFAVNAKDGSTIWTASVGGTAAPYYDDESKLLIVTAGGGTINALDAMSGEMKWSQRITMQGGGSGWSSPIVSGNLAVVGVSSIDMGGFKGGVAAFDKMTGTSAWEYVHATTNGASIWSGPGADDDGFIYAASGNNYGGAGDDRSDAIFSVSAMTGERMWNYQASMGDVWALTGGSGPDHDFGTNPIIVDVKGRKLIAAGQKSGVFHVLDRTTGQPVASLKISQRSSQANGGILNNGAFDGKNLMFIAGANEAGSPGSTVGMSADPETMTDMQLKEVWRIQNTGVLWAPFSTANGVCFITDNSTLRVLNCADGTELKTFTAPGTIGSAPAISEGRVFYGAGFSYQFGGGTIQGGRSLVALGLE